MHSMRRIVILALATLACGAASPTPIRDAADSAVADTPHGCPLTHFRIGVECISGTDTACGPMRVTCARGTSCTLVSGGGGLRPDDVRCERD